MKKLKNFLSVTFPVLSFVGTIISLILCIYDRPLILNYGPLIKVWLFWLWFLTYFILLSFIVNLPKLRAFFHSSIYAFLFTFQILFINSAFDYIYIQHFYHWRSNITFFKTMSLNISNDFTCGNFLYLRFYLLILAAALLRYFLSLGHLSRLINWYLEDDFDDFDEKFHSKSSNNKLRCKKMSKGKRNSLSRAKTRRMRKNIIK